MNSRIIVFGYYSHSNIGDDQYVYSISRLLGVQDISFIPCEKVTSHITRDSDIILLGGGDVLNDYFVRKLKVKFEGKPNKIIAISCGIPDINYLLDTDNLSILDYIFLRTKTDIKTFQKHFHPNRIFYMPDASVALGYLQTMTPVDKKVMICLSRHMYDKDTYDVMLSKIKDIVSWLLSKEYRVIFVPFNTNQTNHWENDIIVQNDLKKTLEDKSNILFIEKALQPGEIMDIMSSCEFVIPMRYHACLFSIYANVPFFPIYSTRKIQNLLIDIKWNHSYVLETNGKGKPIDIYLDKCLFKLKNFIGNYGFLYKQLCYINTEFKIDTIILLGKLYNCIYLPYEKENKTQNTEKTVNSLIKIIEEKCSGEDKHTIAKLITFYLTGQIHNSPYTYGILNKMEGGNYNMQTEFTWIVKDFRKKPQLPDNPYGLFNLSLFDQYDYSNCHRSGWQYVYSNIAYLNNREKNLILDLYLDKTFHWDKKILKLSGVIPYKTPWFGFIHHTFNTDFTDYNCSNLLKDDLFIQSLEHCKGLIVLSEYLQMELQAKLPDVKVFYIPHPTEITDKKFNIIDYIQNKDKKLLSIGGWLRDIYKFYKLETTEKLRKVALKGKHNNNYFPQEDFDVKLNSFLSQLNTSHNDYKNISQDNSSLKNIKNNWYRGLYKDTIDVISSVETLDYVSNEDYDDLLSKNIVYINLLDASAVNTVVECFVRNTPIIINKNPAVVEILGEAYPLYSDDRPVSYLTNPINILMANLYLSSRKKDRYRIDYFRKRLVEITSFI